MLTFSAGGAFARSSTRADVSAVCLPYVEVRFALTALPFSRTDSDVPKGRATQFFRRELT